MRGHSIMRLLGEGGMGEVYLARHDLTGAMRVVKVIHDDAKSSPGIAKRFRREAMVLGRLQHPGIVAVIDFGHLPNGWPFLILEFIEGGDLYGALHTRGPMPLSVGLQTLHQLARILEYAHGQGVVHRDLKPANLLLRNGDPQQVKVIDFGLVKLLSADLLTRLTAERQIMGSPHYMAPEQARASPDITDRADVYAWAGIAYAALSGRPLFAHRKPLALICAQIRERPERLSARLPIPPELDDLLVECLDKDPSQRPSAASVAGRIEALGSEHGMPAASLPSPPPEIWSPPPPTPIPQSPAAPTPFPVPDGWAESGSVFAQPVDPAAITPAGPLILSDSMVREQDVLRAADAIFAPLRPGENDLVREALQRQMLAVVYELAEVLSAAEPSIAARRQALEEIEASLGDVEMDQALVVDQLDGADAAARVDLEERRAELACRAHGLRRRRDSEQRELAVLVDGRREAAPADASRLFGELDDMIGRAEHLVRGVS